MNTTTTSDTPQKTTSGLSPFARGATIDGRKAERWQPSDAVDAPLRWRKDRCVWLSSDLFHKDVPFEFIDRVFAVMALCPQHTFQVLTKRPERMAEYLAGLDYERLSAPVPSIREGMPGWQWKRLTAGQASPELPLPNVWLGTSVEDQPAADVRIPHLLKCPAAVRFLSCEPLLGALDLSAFFGGPYVGLPGDKVHDNYNFGIHWLIVGGESGPGARACNVAWICSIVAQCRASGVPVFVKQFGSAPYHIYVGDTKRTKDPKGGDPTEWPEDLRVREMPGDNGRPT